MLLEINVFCFLLRCCLYVCHDADGPPEMRGHPVRTQYRIVGTYAVPYVCTTKKLAISKYIYNIMYIHHINILTIYIYIYSANIHICIYVFRCYIYLCIVYIHIYTFCIICCIVIILFTLLLHLCYICDTPCYM